MTCMNVNMVLPQSECEDESHSIINVKYCDRLKGAYPKGRNADGGPWATRDDINGRIVAVGEWPTAEAAARAYDHVVISLKVCLRGKVLLYWASSAWLSALPCRQF